MSQRKKTKIVATLGPASDSLEVLEQMILNGVDVFRINFSHAEYSDVEKRVKNIRDLNKKLNTCLLYTSPSPRDVEESRMPSSA